MNLKKLSLKHFRNHKNSSFNFSSKTNVFVGDNGQGKTNIIEAISYLCLTKSFFTNSDLNVLSFESEFFEVEGKFTSDTESEYEVRVAFDKRRNEKFYSINRHRVEPFTTVLGKFPVVICSPEYTPITTAGPVERRKFVDFVISQSNSNYLKSLISYRKVVKHRNKILLNAKSSKQGIEKEIEPWNEQLVNLGSYLMSTRKVFIEEFKNFICSSYKLLTSTDEIPSIEYKASINIKDSDKVEEVRDIYFETIKAREKEEKLFGTTLVGPHRDEFVFKLNEHEMRKYASQGQHKTFLVALKMGEFYYLRERCREVPLLLLDDIFSELDEKRSEKLLNFVENLSQTFITTTKPQLFMNASSFFNGFKVFYVKNGTVEEKARI